MIYYEYNIWKFHFAYFISASCHQQCKMSFSDIDFVETKTEPFHTLPNSLLVLFIVMCVISSSLHYAYRVGNVFVFISLFRSDLIFFTFIIFGSKCILIHDSYVSIFCHTVLVYLKFLSRLHLVNSLYLNSIFRLTVGVDV